MKKILFLGILAVLYTSCNDSTYTLEWKINPQEKLIYKTNMEIVKNKSSISGENNLLEMVRTASKLKGDTIDFQLDMKDFYNNIIEQNNAVQHFSFLEKKDGLVNIEVLSTRKKKISKAKYPIQDFIPAEGVFFSGRINANGTIEENNKSFLQNHLINIMFELPKKPVAIGDSWPLDIKLYGFGQKHGTNKVTLVDIIDEGEDEIAMLEYNIISGKENQNLLMGSMDFTGEAEFNITKGKWVTFKGTMVFSSIGFTEMKQTQIIELHEISEPEYLRIIDSYRKADGSITSEKFAYEKEPIETPEISNANSVNKNKPYETKKQENTDLKAANCPIIYSVQILATEKPIAPGSKQFKNTQRKIQERYDPSHPKFKYKYVIGHECSIANARKLKKQLKKEGFPGAFIVKKKNI